MYGIGPVIAGRILAEAGDIIRFATKDAFASYNGTAPIDVSSGDQIRHRLSRAGNRRINHALHMMAVTQIRNPGTPGRLYYERKRTEGKTPKEALRCLKRRLSDLVRLRFSETYPDQVTCYAVGLPGHDGRDGEPLWYGGGRLSAGLALPQLRRWDPFQQVQRPGSGSGSQQRRTRGATLTGWCAYGTMLPLAAFASWSA